MAQPKAGSPGQPGGGGAPTGRTRRRRTVLNLGMPFLQIDDFVNQSEDAVRLAYRVLVQTVEEIRAGDEEAKDFHKRDSDAGGTLPIEWENLVTRMQNMQTIGLDAVRDGSKVILDSMKTGMESTKKMAKTWEQSRKDIDDTPVMAGPVFEDRIEVRAKTGYTPPAVTLKIRHRGLMRLRIDAVVSPPPKRLVPSDSEESEADRTFKTPIRVSFEPSADPTEKVQDISVLRVEFDQISDAEKLGVYDGIIRASNFELLIARLRITVEGAAAEAAAPPPAAGAGRQKSQPPTRPGDAKRAPPPSVDAALKKQR